MLPFLLMFLAAAGIHSVPLQENCAESEAAFHGCLRKHQSELAYSDNLTSFKNFESIFIQCGAKQSDCYLQKTLMTMINTLTNEETCDFDRAFACVLSLPVENLKECHKKCYNEHGFHLPLSECAVEDYKCDLEIARKLSVCTEEDINEVEKLVAFYEKRAYSDKLETFLSFVKLNVAPSEIFVQPAHCAESETEFKTCLQSYKIMQPDVPRIRNTSDQQAAFLECGAESSDCYLQKNLLKMINTVIDNEVQYNDRARDTDKHDLCTQIIDSKEMESVKAECMKDAFDEHGFPKPDGEFNFHEYRCMAQMAEESDYCTSESYDKFMEIAVAQYQITLAEFSAL